MTAARASSTYTRMTLIYVLEKMVVVALSGYFVIKVVE